LDAQFSVNAIATVQNLRRLPTPPYATVPLSHFGGVFFARADRSDIGGVADLAGLRLVGADLTNLGAGQSQWHELTENYGLSFWNLPKQVLFSHNQYKVAADVASGAADVGMARTDFLESLQLPPPYCNATAQAAIGLGCFPEGTFKVLDARTYPDYPFPGGTQLYPEWPLGALSHITPDVQKAVAGALFELGTSPALLQYTDAARVSTFIPPMSYMGVRDMLHTQNWILNNSCIKSTDIFDTIVCMPGSFRLAPEAVNTSCAAHGLPCPAGYSCVCEPCATLDEDPMTVSIAIASAPANVTECVELQVCVEGTQNAALLVTLTDNWFDARDELGLAPVGTVAFKMDTSLADRSAAWLPASGGGGGTWTVVVETPHTGLAILELSIDGVAQTTRHTFVSIVPPVCTGRDAQASLAGYCECPTAYVASGENGDCVPGRGLVLAAAVGSTVGATGLVLLIVAGVFLARRRAEALWRIPNSAITFTDPPEVLGRGTFGLVVKGQYRGTTVALKRSLPMEPRGSRSGSLTSRGTSTVASMRIRSSSGSQSGHYSLERADMQVVNADVSSSVFSLRPAAASSGGFTPTSLTFPARSGSGSNRTSVFDAPAVLASVPRRQSIDEEAATRTQPTRSLSGSASMQQTSSSVLPVACATKCGLLDEVLGIMAQRRRAASLRADFVREMRLLVHLRHPHILTVLGAVLHDAEPLLVMEYMGRGAWRVCAALRATLRCISLALTPYYHCCFLCRQARSTTCCTTRRCRWTATWCCACCATSCPASSSSTPPARPSCTTTSSPPTSSSTPTSAPR
jgi:hypothetical protein